MSDKALKYLIENTAFKNDFYVIFGQDEAARILESYADQEKKEYLKDVLGETNGLAQWAIKNNWTYNYSSGKWMQLQQSQNYISLTTEQLAEKALKEANEAFNFIKNSTKEQNNND